MHTYANFFVNRDAQLGAQKLDGSMLVETAFAARMRRLDALGPLRKHRVLTGRERRHIQVGGTL